MEVKRELEVEWNKNREFHTCSSDAGEEKIFTSGTAKDNLWSLH